MDETDAIYLRPLSQDQVDAFCEEWQRITRESRMPVVMLPADDELSALRAKVKQLQSILRNR